MMTDEQKTEVAKKNYALFCERMTTLFNKMTQRPFLKAYVYRRDGHCVEDYYWTDEKLTPSAFYKWLLTYNNGQTAVSKWVSYVKIPSNMFDYLLTELNVPHADSLNFDGVLVYPIK